MKEQAILIILMISFWQHTAMFMNFRLLTKENKKTNILVTNVQSMRKEIDISTIVIVVVSVLLVAVLVFVILKEQEPQQAKTSVGVEPKICTLMLKNRKKNIKM